VNSRRAHRLHSQLMLGSASQSRVQYQRPDGLAPPVSWSGLARLPTTVLLQAGGMNPRFSGDWQGSSRSENLPSPASSKREISEAMPPPGRSGPVAENWRSCRLFRLAGLHRAVRQADHSSRTFPVSLRTRGERAYSMICSPVWDTPASPPLGFAESRPGRWSSTSGADGAGLVTSSRAGGTRRLVSAAVAALPHWRRRRRLCVSYPASIGVPF
jgi:hypothetical protein